MRGRAGVPSSMKQMESPLPPRNSDHLLSCSRCPSCKRRPIRRHHRSRAPRPHRPHRHAGSRADRRSLGLGRRRPARQARLHPRLRQRAPGHRTTPPSRHAGDALLHRLHLQAVHRRRHPLLQEEGKLSLDDPVGKYVPGLTRGDEVTIRQILSHTSGYQDYWPEDYVMTPMLRARERPADPRHLGQKASRLRARNPVAVLQHQLRHRRPHRRTITGEPLMDFLTAASSAPRHDLRLELRRRPSSPRPTPRPTIATPSAPCASRPKRAAAGCSPPASWP
jgi:hypothetical protein